MRLQLHLSPNTEPVPFNHLHCLTGTLHKWLGKNNVHDGLSLYSFGWLRGAKRTSEHLHFPTGSLWNISFYDAELPGNDVSKKLIQGILKQPEVFAGMQVTQVQEQATPEFGNFYRFRTDHSAILARKSRPDGSRAYLLWDNPQSDDVLTHLLRRKLAAAGYGAEHQDVQVRFDRSYQKARTRKVTIKGIHHKGSECLVWVAGTPEAVQFAWLVGLGDLTGSGFGGLV